MGMTEVVGKMVMGDTEGFAGHGLEVNDDDDDDDDDDEAMNTTRLVVWLSLFFDTFICVS